MKKWSWRGYETFPPPLVAILAPPQLGHQHLVEQAVLLGCLRSRRVQSRARRLLPIEGPNAKKNSKKGKYKLI